jgi:putative membrane protein (TIGR04086 family)
MKKTIILLLMCILSIVGMSLLAIFEIISKELVAKSSLFITAIISFLLAYFRGNKKQKNGLANGIIIGITIAILSLIIHFITKTEFYSVFFVRGLIFMISGAMGGIIGVNRVKEKTDEVYAIIHTAGIYDLDSLLEIEEERLLKIFNVNLFGAYRINKACLPLLKKGSRIVMVTSELAPLTPLPFTGIYAITKTSLENYAHSLRVELSLLGVFLSVIRPGAVKTDMIGASTTALDKFCKRTKLYPVNAKRFKKIVDSVENKTISPNKIAKKIEKSLKVKKPKLTYNINRNFLLRLLSSLPKRLQVFILKQILR